MSGEEEEEEKPGTSQAFKTGDFKGKREMYEDSGEDREAGETRAY